MNNWRADFPILSDERYIYFDNAATSQRPKQVTDAITRFYEQDNANPLRGLYEWSVRATDDYENARSAVAEFLHAKKAEEIIFTRNTTESLNLVAYSYGLSHLNEGDEIVVCITEHHSNLLPWQMCVKKKGAVLKFFETEPDGTLTEEEIRSKITEKTKIVAIGHVSNVLGVTHPVKKIAQIAHEAGAVVVVDGAQSAPHIAVDVQELGADFYAISGHKMLGPMGIGALYGRMELLEEMPPFLTGGEMIEFVTREDATYAEVPHKFEAGTVNAAGAYGMAAGIAYLKQVGFDAIMQQEEKLTARLLAQLKELPHITVYGSEDPAKHSGIVTFNVEGCHPHDVSSILDEDHVCIRAGHHCAQPLLQYLGVNATCRASMYFYNTEEEVDRFVEKLAGVRKELGYGS
ncbi:MAG: SufS family cysteine desulfurase [Lachnospiraceae bacterium]|nr:SufS family cysteine desulfurase [Lachnospiraceae bacterium]